MEVDLACQHVHHMLVQASIPTQRLPEPSRSRDCKSLETLCFFRSKSLRAREHIVCVCARVNAFCESMPENDINITNTLSRRRFFLLSLSSSAPEECPSQPNVRVRCQRAFWPPLIRGAERIRCHHPVSSSHITRALQYCVHDKLAGCRVLAKRCEHLGRGRSGAGGRTPVAFRVRFCREFGAQPGSH